MLFCDRRVSAIIMNLLSLAQDKAVPAADDFVPVLVYVSLFVAQLFGSCLLVLLIFATPSILIYLIND